LTEDGKLLLERYSEVKKNILFVIEKLDGRLMK